MDIKEVAKWFREILETGCEPCIFCEHTDLKGMAEACERFTWRPIETAPMDNVDKLLWVDGFAIVGRRSYTGDGTWYCELETTGDYVEPTHWMPLPDAPQP